MPRCPGVPRSDSRKYCPCESKILEWLYPQNKWRNVHSNVSDRTQQGALLLPPACRRKRHHCSDRYVPLVCPSRTESSTRGADSRRCRSRTAPYASARAARRFKGPGRTLETTTARHGQDIWPAPPRLTRQAASVSAGGRADEPRHRTTAWG